MLDSFPPDPPEIPDEAETFDDAVWPPGQQLGIRPVRSDVLSSIRIYEGDFETAKSKCSGYDEGETVIQSLQQSEQTGDEAILEAIAEWKNSSGSAILTIDGSIHGAVWATRLAIEMIEIAKVTEDHDAYHHFCGVQSEERGPSPHRVVEHLLGQLLQLHGHRFDSKPTATPSDKSRYDLDRSSTRDMWILFVDCLAQAKVKSVAIILDQIDALYTECEHNPIAGAKEEFDDFVDGLWSLMRMGITIKVIITSASSDTEALDCIRRGAGRQSEHTPRRRQ